MLKATYCDKVLNKLEVYEDDEKLHIVVQDKAGVKVTEVVLNNRGEAHTWVKRKKSHNLWDERE